MKTDVISVSGQKKMMETAIGQADKVAAYKGLSEKDAMHLRLLTEEMMGLMQSVTGADEGEFWIEDEDGEYRLHLLVRTLLSTEKKEQLLSVSGSGKNESAKGLLGRMREFFDWGVDDDITSNTLFLPDMYEHTSSPMLDWEWSMRQYETALSARVAKEEPGAQEAWDELEKSVVKKVADDVKVYLRRGTAEMVILKKLA
jgi:hypothetical protein